MGRGKAIMELIKKERLRKNTFLNRNNNLKKKVYELATLCGIKAMVIIYGPKEAKPQTLPLQAETWPENRDEVLELINKYKGMSAEDRKNRTTLLLKFFQEKNKKAQQDLTKLRSANVRSKYPTWDSRFDSFTEEDFRKIVDFLQNNIGNAKAKLEQMKATRIYNAYHVQPLLPPQQQQQQQQQQHMMLSKKRNMDFDAENRAEKYNIVDRHQAISDPTQVPIQMPLPIHQQQRFSFIDHNWNQMMVNFDNEYAVGTSNMVHNAPLAKAVYDYPTMAGSLDSISYVNNLVRASPNYYDEGWQPIAQHVMEYQPMIEGFNSQIVATSHQYYEDSKWRR